MTRPFFTSSFPGAASAWDDVSEGNRRSLPRMPRGGLFVAHNVINKRNEMGDFLHAIETNPDLFTTIVAPAGEGVSVSWKRR